MRENSAAEQQWPVWEIWARWTVASTIGGGLGLVLGAFLLPFTFLALLIGLPLLGGLIGGILGACQVWGMRGRLALDERWVLVTALGWALGFPVGVLRVVVTMGQPQAAGRLWEFVAVGAGIGLIVGLGQRWLLRPSPPPQWSWLVGTIVAYAVSWGVGMWLINAPRWWADSLVAILVIGLLSGATGGTITGGLVAWLLRPARPTAGPER